MALFTDLINGLTIISKPVGTVIGKNEDGTDAVVSEGHFLLRGSQMFVSEGDYERVKAHPRINISHETGQSIW